MLYALKQVDKESYDRIARSYIKFMSVANDPKKEPVRVFGPLPEKMLAELELIREISKELQLKKEQEEKLAKESEAQAKKEGEEEEATKEETKEDGEVTEVTEEKKEE